jgi:ABC-type antimicrobial peptide transport system permease subunit
MISITDSFRLASLKFKAYKARSVVTIITLSVGVIAVLSVLLAVAGVTDLGKQAFRDSLYGKYYLSIQLYPKCENDGVTCKYSFDQKAFERKYAKFPFKNFESQYTSESYAALDGMESLLKDPTSYNSNNYTVQTSSPEMINDVLFSGESFTKESDVIPIIVPEMIINKDYYLAQQYTGKQRFEMYSKLFKEVRGKEFYLSVDTTSPTSANVLNNDGSMSLTSTTIPEAAPQVSFKKTNIKVKVVGIITQNYGGFIQSPLGANFYIPKWALAKNQDISKVFKMSEPTSYSTELASKKNRDDLMNSYYGTMSFDLSGSMSAPPEYSLYPVQSQYEIFSEIINVIGYVVVGIAIFLLSISALFIFTTINKIAGDSKKEVAIFRSYGATKNDIILIFNTYVLSLVSYGFILGGVISVIITIIISVLWGEDTFYFIVNSGNNFNIVRSPFVFLGFPVLYVFGFLGITYLVGIVAALLPILKASRIQPILALRDE